MTKTRPRSSLLVALLLSHGMLAPVWAQPQSPVFEPTLGQEGKDVVWMPTPPALVEEMLDLARVTSRDFVVDLGSGDGRNVIAAARRGARALGVEYNPDLVALSRQKATDAGVSDKATFVEGDMYEADISDATVLALFLVPENLDKLRPKFLSLKPGTRIVSNTFGMEGWTADQEVAIPTCNSFCTALLWIVPANVDGAWTIPQGELRLTQRYQMVSGTWTSNSETRPIARGRLNGEQISFAIGDTEYVGRVQGDRIEGTSRQGQRQTSWGATRER